MVHDPRLQMIKHSKDELVGGLKVVRDQIEEVHKLYVDRLLAEDVVHKMLSDALKKLASVAKDIEDNLVDRPIIDLRAHLRDAYNKIKDDEWLDAHAARIKKEET